MNGDENGRSNPATGRRSPRPSTAAAGPNARAARVPRLGGDLGPVQTPVSALPNLGPATEAELARVGITSAEDLRAIGADGAYARLLAAGTRPHFIAYYVLHMALQGRPWNDCKGAEKAALRTQFDALKSAHLGSDAKGRLEFEAALQFFGVVEKRR
jgi:DNA transformation protein and related proteins